MKRSILYVSIFLALVVSPLTRAETAQPLTDEYIAAIRSGCSDALQGLLQVEKSEAATRVNRGREYEALLKLAASFNSRVVFNKLDAPLLTSSAARMQSEFTSFQQNYLTYAEKVDAALDTNCKQAPVSFYDNLTAAREAREKVAQDIRDIDYHLNEYQKGLDSLKNDLARLEKGVQQ